ncbi:phage protein Gp27 family protein [Varunaivibrio sulfuroxidans]|uniref:Uncharacterized protein DUF3486 n=1 Tax=Varunaivibrio sulfuroxidans TaxID=1773489 RepID=A0A4R3JAJ0_9PROT|nr:phage protein Gp27 family protein [Varunaivibrio sulfuroxidans]TCS62574.1 uncharacterized protein DUF3486 [Varunaivibrio sulfuroxidans]WES30757.1 DUF3486 family protein [Varunaivibrio sulfuroxidans]
MGQKSTIQTGLEDDDRKALDGLIVSGKMTLMGLLEWLGERGYDISRSALHRHVKKVEKMGAKLRQSRAMTEALVKDLGPDITEGKQGRLLVEVLRSLVFDHLSASMESMDDDGGLDTKDLSFLSKALKDLAGANKIDLDREMKIREDAEKKAKADAAARVKAVLKETTKQGITKETRAAIIDGILGAA